MRVVFTEYARLELQDAIAFYELEVPGLGRIFKEEVKKAVLRMTVFPEAWSIERGANAFSTDFHTKFFIPSKKTTF